MAATNELKRSLYAAQEAWRPVMRRPTKDQAARNILLFGDKIVRTKPSTKAGAAQAVCRAVTNQATGAPAIC